MADAVIIALNSWVKVWGSFTNPKHPAMIAVVRLPTESGVIAP
ncbi:MAG: hypothetical protein OEM00_10560 [Burkholderiaceae bacterium]|nr:hypothetical protein [Burkholderiaceae bacterium]MDH3461390.1 hypothetical protein [Burkholderiaceae bacterium]